MRTFLPKWSQYRTWYEPLAYSTIITRYGQLLIYIIALGVIAYFYIVAQDLLMQYLAGHTPEPLQDYP